MTDILDTLRSYPDDASIMMSKRVVEYIIDEIARLRAELAAALKGAEDDRQELFKARAELAAKDRTLGENIRQTLLEQKRAEAAEAERDALRAELAYERVQHKSVHEMLCKEVDELEAERDALRALLGEVRKMAENGVLYNEPLNARIDAALKGDDRE